MVPPQKFFYQREFASASELESELDDEKFGIAFHYRVNKPDGKLAMVTVICTQEDIDALGVVALTKAEAQAIIQEWDEDNELPI